MPDMVEKRRRIVRFQSLSVLQTFQSILYLWASAISCYTNYFALFTCLSLCQLFSNSLPAQPNYIFMETRPLSCNIIYFRLLQYNFYKQIENSLILFIMLSVFFIYRKHVYLFLLTYHVIHNTDTVCFPALKTPNTYFL